MKGRFFELRKDGQVKATGDTYNECLIKLQNRTSTSWERSFKEGWSVAECVERFVIYDSDWAVLRCMEEDGRSWKIFEYDNLKAAKDGKKEISKTTGFAEDLLMIVKERLEVVA